MSEATIICADVLDALADIPENSFDGCLTDPPYGIRFMGKAWDGAEIERQARENALARKPRMDGRKVPIDGLAAYAGSYDLSVKGNRAFQAWCERWARSVLHVLKPGAHLLAFGGTRTFHRLTCAVEDAGFEIRDAVLTPWIYGSGFPKSRQFAYEPDPEDPEGKLRRLIPGLEYFDGYGTALKPAWEPVILAMKPLDGTFAQNAERWGVAGLWVDGGRIGTGDDKTGGGCTAAWYPTGEGKSGLGPGPDRSIGRWPANLILDESAARLLDEQAGDLTVCGGPKTTTHNSGAFGIGMPGDVYSDSGGPSRFFYTAKASSAERNRGLEGMEKRPSGIRSENSGQHITRRDGGAPGSVENHHPTVKPLALTAYLAKLILPPERDGEPRRLLVPFAGSGSEVIGALRVGWEGVTAIELEAEYVEIAQRRIEGDAPLFNHVEGILSHHG